MVYNELKEAQSDTPSSLLSSLHTMRNIHFLLLIFSTVIVPAINQWYINPCLPQFKRLLCWDICCHLHYYKYDLPGLPPIILIDNRTDNKNIWLSFTNGRDEDWAVQITTAFSVANTVANVLSGWATDFCLEQGSTHFCIIQELFLPPMATGIFSHSLSPNAVALCTQQALGRHFDI